MVVIDRDSKVLTITLYKDLSFCFCAGEQVVRSGQRGSALCDQEPMVMIMVMGSWCGGVNFLSHINLLLGLHCVMLIADLWLIAGVPADGLAQTGSQGWSCVCVCVCGM